MKANFPLQHTTNRGTYFRKVLSKVQEGSKAHASKKSLKAM